MARSYDQACPIARTLDIIGDRWTLLIVRDLLPGARRFNDLLASLPGISPPVLSERLKLLEEQGIVARSFYSEHPPRASYHLTDKGRELRHVLGALAIWGGRHVYEEARLTHTACGHPVRMSYRCPECDTPVRGDAVRLVRQPATEPAGVEPNAEP